VKRIVLLLLVVGMVAASADESVVPKLVTLGRLANRHEAVSFDHELHVEVEEDCVSCHHQPFGEPPKCSSCHDEEVSPSAFVHELHWEVEDCTGCHHRDTTGDLRCVTCHPVGVDPQRPAVIGLKGAYHGLCLRCHGETGSKASCPICHTDG
jgi:hypothetical protein